MQNSVERRPPSRLLRLVPGASGSLVVSGAQKYFQVGILNYFLHFILTRMLGGRTNYPFYDLPISQIEKQV